jgi:hypothetical protein
MPDARVRSLEAWDPAPVTTALVSVWIDGDVELSPTAPVPGRVAAERERRRLFESSPEEYLEEHMGAVELCRRVFPNMILCDGRQEDPGSWSAEDAFALHLRYAYEGEGGGLAWSVFKALAKNPHGWVPPFFVTPFVAPFLFAAVPVWYERSFEVFAKLYDGEGRLLARATSSEKGNLVFWLPALVIMVHPWDYLVEGDLATRDCLRQLSRLPIWSSGERPDDRHEPNDTLDAATPLKRARRYKALRSQDNDWYAVDLQAGELLDVTLRFDHDADDLDLSLHDATEATLATSETDEDTEHVQYRATSAGPVYIRVKPSRRVGAEYVLEVR